MFVVRILIILAALSLPSWGATFGRTVALVGGGTDLAFDESRGRLYFVQSALNSIQIYSLAQAKYLTPISTDTEPLAAALSRNGQVLYVACYSASTIDVIDLTTLAVTTRIALPAKPEAIAVAGDNRVLITTSGSGTGNASNILLLYDPVSALVTAIPVAPTPAPAAPTFPPPSSRPYLSTHAQLRASRDGNFIAGVNIAAGTTGTVFVYQTSSATVLRSRVATGSSNVLAISDDGSRILCGVNLFEGSTLQVLGQTNIANSPYPIPPTAVLTTAANQGGSVFTPDSQSLLSIFNVGPVNSTGNVGQMMVQDPDNLLIKLGLQLPEYLAGKIVISADGANAYALSDTGFVVLPLGTISTSPIAVPSTDVVLLTNDQCGVYAQNATSAVTINNGGKGTLTATSSLLQYAGVANQSSPTTAPSVRANQTTLSYSYNTLAARGGSGTATPPHDFLVTSAQAINIPDRVRVYENNRDSDSRGTILPVATSITATAGLNDMVYDQTRQRLYISNTGLNRVEVFDIKSQQFLAPIKVGQLPFSLALTPDGATLYAGNLGGESISIVDPDKMLQVGRVTFPPLPFGSNLAPIAPYSIAAGSSGLQVLLTNGALYRVDGTVAVPRGISTIIGQTAAGAPVAIPVPSTMSASPDGQYILLFTNTGFAYLYDANVDDFIAARQVFPTSPTGYVGPVAAGAKGQYFVVDGTLLNSSLVPVATTNGLVAAVTAVTATSYGIYSPPPAAAANSLPATLPTVQLLNANNGNPTLQVSALESPATQITAAARATYAGRSMAIDTAGGNAYVLTLSGLSIVPLTAVAAADRPQVFTKGAVNLGSYQTAVAQNSLISIFGQNLGASEVASNVPLPYILGGTCVTLGNAPLPLFMSSTGQINAQIPPAQATGSAALVVRSITRQAASASQNLAVSKYAPAVLVDSSGQILLFHADGRAVSHAHPADRDEPLVMYAVGLGATTGGKVTAGQPSPSSPLAETSPVNVYFGDPTWVQAGIIVDFSGLAPGMIGIYQLNLRVPGFHISGDSLLVTLSVGGVSSPSTGPVVPHVSVN